MEPETTQEPGGAGGTEPRSFCWYVALMQLPGVATKARLACLQAAHEGLARLPVASRRSHVWHSLQPARDAAGGEELSELALGETALHGVPASA
jgi:hypothetical protein